MNAQGRILVALDTPELERARALVARLSGRVGGFKIGLELFCAHGPSFVREVVGSGAPVFLDLKLHDIPNTVEGAAAAAGRLGPRLLTVHALGGAEMIARAVRASAAAAAAAGFAAPAVLAVTILTSHDAQDLERIGIEGPPAAAVPRLARLAREAGAAGVVCSALEVAAVRREFPEGTLVVPGIRPAESGVASDDQKRAASPARALREGADWLVVGRPITGASDPAVAALALAREIEVGGLP